MPPALRPGRPPLPAAVPAARHALPALPHGRHLEMLARLPASRFACPQLPAAQRVAHLAWRAAPGPLCLMVEQPYRQQVCCQALLLLLLQQERLPALLLMRAAAADADAAGS